MADERITSGGGEGTSGTGGQTDAEEELTDRDPGSGGGDGSGLDIPDSVYGDIGGSGGGGSGGSGGGSSGGDDRSTDEGITSGGGETTTSPIGGGGSPTPEEELTDRDPGSGDGDGSESGSSSAGDSGSQQQSDQDVQDRVTDVVTGDLSGETASDEAEQIAQEQVGATLETGLEGRAGGPEITRQARELEEQAIAQSPYIDDPSDVAIVEEEGRLVAQLSRSGQTQIFAGLIDRNMDRDMDQSTGRETRRQRVLDDIFGGRTPGRDAGITPGDDAEQVTTSALQRFEREDFVFSGPGADADIEVSEEAKREDALQQLDDTLENQTGVELERGEDYTVSEEDGQLQAMLQPGYGDKEARIEQARQEDDIFSDAVTPVSYVASLAGLDSPVDGSVVNQARVEREFRASRDEDERPGTIAQANVPFSDENLVETLETGSDVYQSEVAQPIVESGGDFLAGPAGAAVFGLGAAPETREEITEGGLSVGAAVTDIPGLAATTLRAGQRFSRAEGNPAFAAELGRASAATGADVTESAIENPARTGGALAGAFATGAAGGRALGVGGRFARDRVRTAGARTFDLEDGTVVNPQTGRYYRPDSDVDDPGAEFPGAQDRELFEEDQAEAIRQQSDEFTPESVDEAYAEAGVEGGTTVKKALDVEPDDGPGRGFRTLDEDADNKQYESPGASAGPEISPYFFSMGQRSSSVSLRPGLPDFGDRATGVFIRTRIDDPDATTLDEFNREMVDRSGETTARTLVESEKTPEEAEVIIPPGAEFTDIGSGITRGVARRFGVGSDFAIRVGGRRIPGTDRKVGGRRIPMRAVADPDLIDNTRSRGFGDFLRSERGQLGPDDTSAPSTRPLGEIARPAQPATDRPLPTPPVSPGGDGGRSDTATADEPDPVVPSSSGGSSGTDDRTIPGLTPPSSGPAASESGGPFGLPSEGLPGFGGDRGGGPPGISDPAGSGGGSSTGGGGGAVGGGPAAEPAGTPAFFPSPNEPARQRTERTEGEADEPTFRPLFGGSRKGIYTDFRNPFGGELLRTEVDDVPTEPGEPAFLGFTQER